MRRRPPRSRSTRPRRAAAPCASRRRSAPSRRASRSCSTAGTGSSGERALRDDPPDDADLVRRMQAGDEAAFREFLARYERLIYAIPRRMGLSADDAADVFQDVTIAFLKGLPRL